MDNKINFPEIGAYYQCYKQPKAFLSAISSYRTVYPSGDLVVISDNGYDYSSFVKSINGHYSKIEEQTGNGKILQFNSIEKAEVFLNRFFENIRKISQPYFVLLEDDVMVYSRIPDSILDAEIIGCNRNGSIPRGLVDNIKKYRTIDVNDLYCGGCGGSLYKTEFFKNLEFDKKNLLSEYQPHDPGFFSDILLSYITWRFGGTVKGPVDELGEVWVQNWQQKVDNGTIKILHQAKWNYNVPLNIYEKQTLKL